MSTNKIRMTQATHTMRPGLDHIVKRDLHKTSTAMASRMATGVLRTNRTRTMRLSPDRMACLVVEDRLRNYTMTRTIAHLKPRMLPTPMQDLGPRQDMAMEITITCRDPLWTHNGLQ